MTDTLRSVAHDLSMAPVKVQREALAIVEHGALNIKRGWQAKAKATSGTHASAYPFSISYSLALVSALLGAIEAEIGPDKSRRQGALGNLLEFGSVNNAPTNEGGRSLREEAPGFERAIAGSALSALGWH